MIHFDVHQVSVAVITPGFDASCLPHLDPRQLRLAKGMADMHIVPVKGGNAFDCMMPFSMEAYKELQISNIQVDPSVMRRCCFGDLSVMTRNNIDLGVICNDEEDRLLNMQLYLSMVDEMEVEVVSVRSPYSPLGICQFFFGRTDTPCSTGCL